jgi:hypothetical protein
MINGLMTPKGIIESDGDEYNDGQKGDYKEYIFIYLHIIYMFYWKKHIYFGRVWWVGGGGWAVAIRTVPIHKYIDMRHS